MRPGAFPEPCLQCQFREIMLKSAGGVCYALAIRPISRVSVLEYQGSIKHKRRPGRGDKGTFCPEWTHSTPQGGLGSQVDGHPWPRTEAHRLFASSQPCPKGSAKRYATARGIAFVAHGNRNGIWHGHPVTWNRVPDELVGQWLSANLVENRDVKKYWSRPRGDKEWPLKTDNE